MSIKAVIFDLDGVIVSTDEYHFLAWKEMADSEGIEFDREINENLRGVSRMESLEIILRKSKKTYSESEKVELATRKNTVYKNLLVNLKADAILPGVLDFMSELKKLGVKMAIGSSSKNTPFILKQIGLDNYFEAVADGNDIKNSKPDPEVFLLAAEKLGIEPSYCLVVEDADAGVAASVAAGMKTIAVGFASVNPTATYRMKDLSNVNVNEVLV